MPVDDEVDEDREDEDRPPIKMRSWTEVRWLLAVEKIERRRRVRRRVLIAAALIIAAGITLAVLRGDQGRVEAASSLVADVSAHPRQTLSKTLTRGPESFLLEAASVLADPPPQLVDEIRRMQDIARADENAQAFTVLGAIAAASYDVRRALVGFGFAALSIEQDDYAAVQALHLINNTYPLERTVDDLAQYLAENSEREDVRDLAMVILSDHPTPSNMRYLRHVIETADCRSRSQVVFALVGATKHRDRYSIPMAARLLVDPNPAIAARAADLLSTCQDGRGVVRLREIARAEGIDTKHPEAQGARLVSIKALADRGDDELDDIAREWFADPRATRNMVSWAADGLVTRSITVTREDVAPLLASPEPWRRARALGLLVRSDDPTAIDEMVELAPHLADMHDVEAVLVMTKRLPSATDRARIVAAIVGSGTLARLQDFERSLIRERYSRLIGEGEQEWLTQRSR